MSTAKKTNLRWLPLALVPLFSVSVLVGCSSDDDSPADTMTVTPPADVDGNGVPDAFESTDAVANANGNTIADVYEAPADASAVAADSNTNGVDDSYEASLTGGVDADNDGIDDAAAAALAAILAGGGTDGGGTDGGGTDGGGTDGGGTDGGGDADSQTGALNIVTVGSAGAANLTWDGATLSGQLDLADGATVNSAALYSGISAAGNGQQIIALNGTGPTRFVPSGMAADDTAAIADAIIRGNLFIRAELADGSMQDGTVLLSGVQPKYAGMTAADGAFSSGAGYVNLNTVTGDLAAVMNISLNPSDVDADGNPQTITLGHIHLGGPTEEGAPIVTLENLSGDGLTWTATAQLNTEQLSAMMAGNTYFNAHATDGSGFIRGQIPAF